MLAPLSWIKDFVEPDLTIAGIAHQLTMAGMEVEEIHIIGLPMPESGTVDTRVTGLSWDPEKIVVGAISEVMPHPNADRLTLCRLFDGREEHIVLTGAPNLFEFKGIGPLAQPLKVAYAKEGSVIYDGHQPGLVLTTLKKTRIRGVDSDSMVCSEKELGLSEEHEGILFLDADAVPGTPLVDVLGDAVFDIKLLPSYARCASILGLAREIAAMTGKPLKQPEAATQPPAGKADFASIHIQNPELNPRFLLGLIRDIEIRQSPSLIQRRLKLAGMRPVNNIVDATNYVMLEIGQPLHAFDYDILIKRAAGKPVEIITRTARVGETLTTLDGVERKLDPSTVLVCDAAGALSIAGVMGGGETEVTEKTRTVLLEGAAWNMINIRKTAKVQNLPSEASYRYSRGVHPAMAERGVRRALELMAAWSGGVVAPGLVDEYPLPPRAAEVEVTSHDVKRWLGIELSAVEIAKLLERLEFKVQQTDDTVRAVAPDHRLDIGEGITGKADLIEEIARVYGYDNIPEERMADVLPPQRSNPKLEKEERIRDLLVAAGLQEVVNYRWTTPENEARLTPAGAEADDRPYVRIANPLAYEKTFLRHSVMASVLNVAERNSRNRDRLAFFEIGPIFIQGEEPGLPDELQRLGIVLAGQRELSGWQAADTASMDFFDLKGILEELFAGLRIQDIHFESYTHPAFHPGKCAKIMTGEVQLGFFGELHPQVRSHYDWPATFKSSVMSAELNLDTLYGMVPSLHQTTDLPTYPPVLEDLALVVDESVPAVEIEKLIRQTGGKLLTDVRLFDLFRSEQIGEGKKSLAYALTYQASDRTLKDDEVRQLRGRIIRRLEHELGAKLRS